MAQRSRKRAGQGPPPGRPCRNRAAAAAVTARRRPRSPRRVRRLDHPGAVPGVRAAESPPAHLPQPSRSEARNAQVRATLRPIEPGERPQGDRRLERARCRAGAHDLVAWVAGDKIGGKHPAAAGIFIFSAVMAAAAIGMWRLWYGAVLGFMALLAIIAVIFTLLLIEASNVLGLVVALAIIGGSGYLFFRTAGGRAEPDPDAALARSAAVTASRREQAAY